MRPSTRKLQFPLDRLEAPLLAQGIDKGVGGRTMKMLKEDNAQDAIRAQIAAELAEWIEDK
jgi:hypothetical protein